MVSPSTALRPWPTVTGPVGLAERNSTCTFLPAPGRNSHARGFQNARPALAAWRISACQYAGAILKLMKPGPATETSLTSAGSVTCDLIISAIARGALRSGLASVSAMFEATSPWAESRGASIPMAGTSAVN